MVQFKLAAPIEQFGEIPGMHQGVLRKGVTNTRPAKARTTQVKPKEGHRRVMVHHRNRRNGLPRHRCHEIPARICRNSVVDAARAMPGSFPSDLTNPRALEAPRTDANSRVGLGSHLNS